MQAWKLLGKAKAVAGRMHDVTDAEAPKVSVLTKRSTLIYHHSIDTSHGLLPAYHAEGPPD